MSYNPLGYPRSCRFCGLGFPMTTEVLVAVPVGDRSLLARRRAAQRPYYEHPSCAADEAQAHAAGELVRTALHQAAAEAAREGRLADAVALAEAASDVLDSHYRRRAA
jgi:hypothetical protein